MYACLFKINHAVAFTVLTSLEAAQTLKLRGTTPYPAYQDQQHATAVTTARDAM